MQRVTISGEALSDMMRLWDSIYCDTRNTHFDSLAKSANTMPFEFSRRRPDVNSFANVIMSYRPSLFAAVAWPGACVNRKVWVTWDEVGIRHDHRRHHDMVVLDAL